MAGAAATWAVRVGLQEARRRGLPFGQAWERVTEVALAELPRGERESWRVALDVTREAWRASYGAAASLRAA